MPHIILVVVTLIVIGSGLCVIIASRQTRAGLELQKEPKAFMQLIDREHPEITTIMRAYLVNKFQYALLGASVAFISGVLLTLLFVNVMLNTLK